MKRRRDDPARLAKAMVLKQTEIEQLNQAAMAELGNLQILADWHHRNAEACHALGNEILYR